MAEVADPDVAVFDGVAVPLKIDGAFFGKVVGVASGLLVLGGALDFVRSLHDDAVEEDGDFGRGDDFAVFGNGRFEDDVVALPFALGGGGIDEGWRLSVDGAGLAVGVGDVGVAFSDLDFVFAHEEDAGVSAFLSHHFAVGGDSVFDMNLAVSKMFFGAEGARGGDEDSVFDSPLAFPGVGIGTVEEDFGVGGGFDGESSATLDFAGLRAGGVVDAVSGAWDEGCVGVELFGLLFAVMVSEEESGGKEGEDGEFCFHGVVSKNWLRRWILSVRLAPAR